MTHLNQSAALLTRRGLLIFALIWQAAWMLSDVSLWPTRQSHTIESLLISSTWVTWLLILGALIASRKSARYPRYLSTLVRTNVAVLGLSAIALSLLSIDPTIDDWIVSASIFNLVAGVAGVSLKNPEQWAWVFGLVFIEFVIFIAFGFSYVGEIQLSSVVLYPLYALAIGVAAASGQRGLVLGADRAEQAQALAIDREIQVLLAQETDRQTAATQAKVHETVLNTMTAVARGGLPDTPEMVDLISQRCGEAALVLREVLDPVLTHFPEAETGLFGAMSDLISECESRGITAMMEGDIGVKIPEQCEKAIVAGVREALINVMRHSHASRVIVRVDAMNSHNFHVSIEDNGQGFVRVPELDSSPNACDSRDQRTGYGWSTILGKDLQSVGVRAWVEPSPTQGSIVHIEYLKPRKWLYQFFRRSPIPTTVLALPILASWLSFSAVNIALAWSDYSTPLINVFTFALLLLFAVVAIRFSRTGALPWWMIFVGVAIAFITYEGDNLARGQMMVVGPWSEWSSEAIAAIFLLLAAASTWWAWMVVGLAWMIIQANFPQELIAPGFTLIMVGGVLGLVLRRSQKAMESALVNASRDGVNAAMARHQAQNRVERFSQLKAQQAIALLEGIAEGRLNRHDLLIRNQCAVQEMYVRNIVISGAISAGSFGLSVAELAREKQAVVEIVGIKPVGPFEQESQVLDFLKEILDHMNGTDRARFSIVPNSQAINLQLVCQFEADPSLWIAPHELELGFVEVDREVSGNYTLMWHLQIEPDRDAWDSSQSLSRGR